MWRVQVWENKKLVEAFLFETEEEALLKKRDLQQCHSALVKVEELDSPGVKESLFLINPFNWFTHGSRTKNRRIRSSRAVEALHLVFAFATIILFSFRGIFTTHSNHILFTIFAEISLAATLILGIGRKIFKQRECAGCFFYNQDFLRNIYCLYFNLRPPVNAGRGVYHYPSK